MNYDELREHLIQQVTDILTTHNLVDYGSRCHACHRELYGREGDGSTLSRHRAEQVVDRMNLVKYLGEHY